MGNDSSVLSEYKIEESEYARIGPWTLHSAYRREAESDKVTVFTGKLKSYGQLSKEFQRAVERLKTLRHPSILKYMNSCVAGETVHLMVEYVTPLSDILEDQTELEVCCGLQNILHALDFIHAKAGIVHNNVCREAVFVTLGGDWKLGLFDLSCSFSEVTQSFLDQIRSFRYEKSVAPEDEGKNKSLGANVPSRDLFGYGQLVKETISKCLDSTVANADVFRDLATKQMQSSNPQTRGSASALAKHPFFDQPLLHAQEFLTEIAIKSHAEKEEFFRNLPSVLYSAPESVVGSKMANSLLSRLVVLNPTAQQHLLPHLLIPRTDTNEGLFDASSYRHFILPVVSRIFGVRDAQIRLILLHYFSYYVQLMEPDQLAQQILPELLLGIKDVDDTIVAATLKALACLVPILGGSTVIGGTRLKLFTNGMPKENEVRPAKVHELARRQSSSAQLKLNGATTMNPVLNVRSLPERHEPDGGEDGGVAHSLEKSETDEHWSDWEAAEEEEEVMEESGEHEDGEDQVLDPVIVSSLDRLDLSKKKSEQSLASPVKVIKKPIFESDLSALEIQVKSREDEIDFFADMEPTITSAPAVFVPVPVPAKADGLSFNVQSQEAKDEDDGWNWDD